MVDAESPTTPSEAPAAPVADSAAPSTPSTPSAEGVATPTAEPGQSKESLLDAVLKVVPATPVKDVLADATKEHAALPEAAPPTSEEQAEAESEDADEEPTPPETTPATRKKINKLLKQRRELRDRVSTLEGPAQIGSELESYARANSLSGEELANGLKIMAMLKAGDYESFYASVAPFVRTAQEYLGVVLPTDLQRQVQQGQMTEAAAKVFARQWYDQQRADYDRQIALETQRHQAVQYAQGDVRRAVTQFESRLAANDPDYKAKAPAVKRVAQALLFENGGSVENVDQALAITKLAYDEVNRQMRAYQPRPQATRPSANGTGQTPSARAAPNSLYEAALQGLDNARRAGG